MPSKRSDWHGQTHMARPTSDAGGSLREPGSKHASGKSRPEGARVSTISQRIASFVARQSAQRARVAVFSALAVVAVVLVAAALHLQALALTHGVWSFGGSASAAAAGDGSEGGVVTIGEGASDAAVEQPAPQPVDPAICRQLDARLVEGDPESESGERVVATVRADVPKDAIPEDAQLFVGLVGEEGFAPAQDAAVQAVEQKADGKVYEALPLDLSLRDAEGNEIDPGCNVTYHVSAGIVEEGADPYAVRIDGEGAAEVMEGPKPWELTGAGQEASVELQHESGESQGEGQQDEAVTELGQEEGQGAAEGQDATEGENQDSAAAEGGAQQGDATEGEQQSAPEVTFTTAGVPDVVVAVATREQTLETAGSNTFDAARLDAPAAAGVPVGSELGVIEVTEDDEAYGPCLDQLRELIGDEPYDVLLYDIGIYRGEGELQPQAAVDVSIDLSDWASELIDGARVVHFGEEGPEELAATREGDDVRFQATGFSVYAIVDVSPEESVPQGPTIVPVTDLDTLAQDVEAGAEFYVQDQNNNGILHDNGLAWSGNGETWGLESTGTPNQYYIYYLDGSTRKYAHLGTEHDLGWAAGTIYNELYYNDSKGDALKFNVTSAGNGYFYLQADGDPRNNGTELYYSIVYGPNQITLYPMQGEGRSKMKFTPTAMDTADIQGLSGTYGIAYRKGEDVAAGLSDAVDKDTGTTTEHLGRLEAQDLEVRPNDLNDQGDVLLKSSNGDLVEWTFYMQPSGQYYITTDNGSTYLTIENNGNLSVRNYQSDESLITVQYIPNTDKITLSRNGKYVAYNLGRQLVNKQPTGAWNDDFRTVDKDVDVTYLNLVKKESINDDALHTFTASKVSVSDTDSVKNGESVVVYTRAWDDAEKHYNYYVVAPDGSLIPAYEHADTIAWYGDGSKGYTWKFIEHTDAGEPNGYYDLQSDDSGVYLGPSGADTTSVGPIGVSLLGREAGAYSSTILSWDADSYAYKGLKVVDGQLVSCPREEAGPFFVATFEETSQGQLTPVATIDNNEHGITMKMVDLDGSGRGNPGRAENKWGGETLAPNTPFFGGFQSKDREVSPGLLETKLEDNGYPKTTYNGASLYDLYNDPLWVDNRGGGIKEVNKLFYESSYLSSGYYEYDSTQTYAYLDGDNFQVYRELGTNDTGTWDIAHGQFFPYNALTTRTDFGNAYASKNIIDRYGDPLPDTDPRKGESMHRVNGAVDYGFGMEMSASFVQTPDGTDDWGHDSIFEFSGDDDFWLYVDGELVLDIGGVHGAIPGKVNFRTGEVSYGVPGIGDTATEVRTNLRDVFWQNYRNRVDETLGRQPTDEEANAYVADLFVEKDGNYVFKPYSSHKIRVFYFERGGGCANLYMRFNLTTASENKIMLSKEIEGLGDDQAKLAEFAYQVQYQLLEGGPWLMLSNDEANSQYRALYKDTDKPVPYRDELDIDGIQYRNVYLLKNGEVADITFPLENNESVYKYRVVECGVDTNVYTQVDVNGQGVTGTDISGHQNRKDFNSGEATIADRAMVAYKNKANPDALHDLTFTKKLFRADGTTPISYANDQQGFDLRLYLSPETRTLAPANAYPYHVLDADGNYCKWSGTTFESLGTADLTSLTPEQLAQATFLTSPNGAVSQIPADHTVQVRNLPEDTKVQVEERTGEVPTGYEFIKYKKDDADYNGDPFTIQGSTNVEVHNKKLGKTVSIKKVDVSSTSTTLPGAVFDLYVVNDGTPEQTALISGLTSDANGLLAKGSATTFDLSAGTYQLVETEAPAGYIKWKDPATITIKYVDESDGSALIDPNDDAVTYDDGTAYSQSGQGRSFDSNSKVYTVSVTNTGGAELPHAGGPGEGLAYALGTLLIVAGLLMYVRRGQPA